MCHPQQRGKVENVILGVGGFLGLHYVAVAYDKLKWSNEPPKTSTANATTINTSRPATSDSNARIAADGRAAPHERSDDDG
jgi:hypothetical protein